MCRRLRPVAIHIKDVVSRVVPPVPISAKRSYISLSHSPNRSKPHILQLRRRLGKTIESPCPALHHTRKPSSTRIQGSRPNIRTSGSRPVLIPNRQIPSQMRRSPVPITINLDQSPTRGRIVPEEGGVKVSFQTQSRLRLIVSPGKNEEIPTCNSVRHAITGEVPTFPFDPPLQSTK